MGVADRIIRMLIAIAFVYLYYNGFVTGVAGVILLVLAGVFVLTSLFGVCPLYSLLGIRTCAVKKTE